MSLTVTASTSLGNSSGATRRKWLWIGVAAVVVVAGGWYWRSSHKTETTTFETEEVARGDLRETISATGTLQAVETVPVGTQVSGTIDQLLVDFNSKVKRGQLLATLDPSVLDSILESARAALSQANAKYSDAVAALEEGNELLAKHYISDRDLRTLKVNVTTSKGQVDAAQADYNRAQRNRQYADIHSPIDGVVIERAVDRGQTVASSLQAPVLFTIAKDLGQMQILASVDESQIGSVKLAQPATFTVAAFPGKKFPAEVQQIRLKSTVTQNVVTYAVVLNANNANGELFPGMTATVDFVLKDLHDVLRVPSAALRIQRVPEELMDAETLKRTKEMQAARDGGTTARAPGTGEGGPTPEQVQAFRQRAASGQSGGRAGMGTVWVASADGKIARLPVRILGSDMTATGIEPVRGELQPGDKVVTKLVSSASAQSTATRSLLPGPQGPRPR